MRKLITGKLTSGLLCVFMVLSVFFSTGVFAATTEADTSADVTNTAAVEDIGVKYWGHVQNKGDMPWVNSPTPLGTRGEGLRIEGFAFDLTGPVPEGAKLVYQVHVQNKGWMTPVSSADFAGTRGESLRVESIRISLENLPGYDVYYRGHVQNVGDIPQASGEWGWVKNGADLGTTGSSLRLEEITVKIVKTPTTTTAYDKAGTFGPATGVQEIAGDAIINVPDVTLQNLHIKGNLTIGEGVGSGNVTLNNVTVDGDTFVNGGGKNSIHINGGSYNKITVEKTATGEVRIVAIGIDGLEVVISEDATGEAIILEGDFADVTVNAPNVNISTQGDTNIENMNVGEGATGCEVTLAEGTSVGTMVLDSGADVKGKGTIADAQVNADGVKFETAPTKQEVDPSVVTPPIVTPPVVPGGGGSSTVNVTGVTVSPAKMNLVVSGNTGTITASVAPSNATNKTVNWTSSDPAKGTVNTNGVVTAVAAGTTTITATTVDGTKTASCVVTVYASADATTVLTDAKLAVNSAASVANMQEALETNAAILGLNLTDYNSLTVPARKTAVSQDMLDNKTRLTEFTSPADIKSLFDNLAEARKDIEYSLGRVNTEHLIYNPAQTDLDFMQSIINDLTDLPDQSTTLSGHPASVLLYDLNSAKTKYYALPTTPTNKRQAVLDGLYANRTYNSLSDMLTELYQQYLLVK